MWMIPTACNFVFGNKKFIKYGFQKLFHENQLSQMHQIFMPPSESSKFNEACAREDGGGVSIPTCDLGSNGLWNME